MASVIMLLEQEIKDGIPCGVYAGGDRRSCQRVEIVRLNVLEEHGKNVGVAGPGDRGCDGGGIRCITYWHDPRLPGYLPCAILWQLRQTTHGVIGTRRD